MSHKFFMNFSYWVRYAMRKMSINNPLRGWLAHESLNRMYYLLPITYYLKIHSLYYLLLVYT